MRVPMTLALLVVSILDIIKQILVLVKQVKE